MKYLALLVLAVYLSACGIALSDKARSVVENEADDEKQPNSIGNLIQRLPYVTLPWTFDLWEGRVPLVELTEHEQQLLANDPEQEAGAAVGLIHDPSGSKHILWLSPADVELPMITTFSPEGAFIHTEGLVIGQCGPGPCYTCKETVQINMDFTILTTDTVTACECDSTYEPLSTPCEHYVTVREGTLSSNGAHMTPQRRIDLSK